MGEAKRKQKTDSTGKVLTPEMERYWDDRIQKHTERIYTYIQELNQMLRHIGRNKHQVGLVLKSKESKKDELKKSESVEKNVEKNPKDEPRNNAEQPKNSLPVNEEGLQDTKKD